MLIYNQSVVMVLRSNVFKAQITAYLPHLVRGLSLFLVVLKVDSVVTVLQLVLGYPLIVFSRVSSLSCYTCYSCVFPAQTQDINLKPLIRIFCEG